VVLLGRFYEERRGGLDPDAAAVAALAGVGRAIRVSALTLGAGFGVLAISGLFPNSLPLLADFGLAVVIDLALAVGAVFLVMLPVAVALERRSPLRLAPVADTAPVAAAASAPSSAKPPSGGRRRGKPAAVPEKLETAPPSTRSEDESPAGPRRLPGVSGRRRAAPSEPPNSTERPRRPGVSGRRRGRRRPGT
jgi:hypothetical protein